MARGGRNGLHRLTYMSWQRAYELSLIYCGTVLTRGRRHQNVTLVLVHPVLKYICHFPLKS